MNIYHISQSDVDGWDTYDSAVVIAESADDARRMRPSCRGEFELIPQPVAHSWDTWTNDPSKVDVVLVGTAAPNETVPRLVCASFNAG